MKLRYFSFAIMLINMLIMFSLLVFTYSIAKDMKRISDLIIQQQEGYNYEGRILDDSIREEEQNTHTGDPVQPYSGHVLFVRN